MEDFTKVKTNIIYFDYFILNVIIGNWENDNYEDFGIHVTEVGTYSGY